MDILRILFLEKVRLLKEAVGRSFGAGTVISSGASSEDVGGVISGSGRSEGKGSSTMAKLTLELF